MMRITERVLKGDRRAVARLISDAEDNFSETKDALKEIYPYTGNAKVIGLTGPPGSGKSTLVDKLTKNLRKQGKTVGIISVDPTSPFTGGALLGDRIRLQDLFLDEGVFIRSMGTRGNLGGLSRATGVAIKILDAFGKDYIFVETVGVGQSEVDIVETADTVALVMVPGLGDDIQAIKAGILEIGDTFVVNKADKEGADRLGIEIEMMLDLNKEASWRPPIVKTVAASDEGIDELMNGIHNHIDFMKENGEFDLRRKNNAKKEIFNLIKEKWEQLLYEKTNSEFRDKIAEEVAQRKKDPYTAVDELSQTALNFTGGEE